MARTLTAGQEAERKKNYVKIVVLVEVDADAPDAAPTTQRYASRKYTLSSNLYSDALSPDNPIETSWARLRVGGGLAAVAGFSVKLANQEKLSNLIDTYFLENDTARLYMIFVTGSETSADRIQLAQGVVENFPFSLREFSLQVIDTSSKDFRAFPANIIDQTTYPFAAYEVLGKPVPALFGSLNEPEDQEVSQGTFFFAPTVCIDPFLKKYIPGEIATITPNPHQWYPQIKKFALIPSGEWSSSGNQLTVDSSTRLLNVRPNRALPTNDVSTWRYAGDAITTGSGGASIVNGSNLDLSFEGMPKLGSISNIILRVSASTNTWNYNIKLRGVSKSSGAGATPTLSVALTASDHADDWDFEQYTIEIDGTGTSTIKEARIEITYADQESLSPASTAVSVFSASAGFADQTAYYRDGGLVTSLAGTVLINPVDQLEAVLRAKHLLNLPVARVDTAGFNTAATLRSGWRFDFSLTEQVDINWINMFCFEAGLSLFLNASSQWCVIAKAKNKTPSHALLHQRDVIVLNKDQSPAQWDYDFRVSRTPMRDLVNEVVLRYRLERASGEYTRLKAATGHYRVTGTNAVVVRLSDTTGTVTSSGATFQTSGVVAGDIVYVWGHLSYTVTSVDSETQVTVSGEVYDDTGRTYYIGPNIDSRMVRSQVRHKTENPLGSSSTRFAEEGGYRSTLIASNTTAQNFIDHLATFRAFSRLAVELGTYWNAVNVELGDIVYLDHPWLPAERRPFLVTTINGAQTSGDTTIDVAAGDAELFQVDDYILVGTEVMKVTGAAGANAITVTRGQLSTTAVAYVGGEQIRRFENKWEVIGIKPEPLKGEWRLELEELPLDYTRIGMAVADGYADYTAATTDQITVAGWATENSGRALESDENSDVSYAI